MTAKPLDNLIEKEKSDTCQYTTNPRNPTDFCGANKTLDPGDVAEKDDQNQSNTNTVKREFIFNAVNKQRVDASLAGPNVKELCNSQRDIKGRHTFRKNILLFGRGKFSFRSLHCNRLGSCEREKVGVISVQSRMIEIGQAQAVISVREDVCHQAANGNDKSRSDVGVKQKCG